jgi:hypothetical protein
MWRALTRRARTTPWTTGRFRAPPCRALLPRPAHTPRDVVVGPSVAGRHTCRHKGVAAPLHRAPSHAPALRPCPPSEPAAAKPRSQGDRDQATRARLDSLRPLPRLLACRSKLLSRPSMARGGHRHRPPVRPLAGPLPAPTSTPNRPVVSPRPSSTHPLPSPASPSSEF